VHNPLIKNLLDKKRRIETLETMSLPLRPYGEKNYRRGRKNRGSLCIIIYTCISIYRKHTYNTLSISI